MRMNGPILAFCLVSVSAVGVAASPPPPLSWVKPVNASPLSGYFDPGYLRSDNVQHLGIDLPAASGTPVSSPVDGVVVANQTDNSDIMQAYLVIRDSANDHEHVLGHITSNLSDGEPVTKGQRVGTVRDWGLNSHVHWGVNTASVSSAMGFTSEGQWGWGRAPGAVTTRQAEDRGWIDPWNSCAALISATSSVPSTVFASQGVPLRVGAYVEASVSCGQASNATLMWFNGRYFDAGRMSPLIPRATRDPRRFVGTVCSIGYRYMSRPIRVTVRIVSDREFTWISEWGSSRKRYCPDSALPRWWRGSTPR